MLTLHFMTAIIKIRFIILIALPECLNIVVFRILILRIFPPVRGRYLNCLHRILRQNRNNIQCALHRRCTGRQVDKQCTARVFIVNFPKQLIEIRIEGIEQLNLRQFISFNLMDFHFTTQLLLQFF